MTKANTKDEVTIIPASNVTIMRPLTHDQIMGYGRKTGSKMAGVADRLTSTVRGSDMDELGKLLGDLVILAKEYNPKSLSNKRRLNPLMWFKKQATVMANQFTSVDTQVTALQREVGERMRQFEQRNSDMDQLEIENEQNYHEMKAQIEELAAKIEEMKANIPEVDDPNDTFGAQAVADWHDRIQLAEHHLADLRLILVSIEQFAPQIRLTKANGHALAMKFSQIQNTTLPTWKSNFSLYILQREQSGSVQLANTIDEATNAAMKQAADMLAINTVATQRALGRNVIDLSTLEYTQAKLIESIKSVQQVRAENQARLANEKPRLLAMSKSLSDQLTAIGASSSSLALTSASNGSDVKRLT